MSFKIEQGLFSLDFTDYHAILGIPVDAEAKEMRKRYLTIARRLHPDSCATENEVDRQKASEFLSKLVNPAYEKLSQEKNYVEHGVLLRLKGQQALKQQETVVLTSDFARRLASASDLDTSYRAALRELSEKQYQHLEQTLDLTGQISELNIVYLMRKESRGESIHPPKPLNNSEQSSTAGAARSTPASPAAKPAPATRESVIAAYLRRAQEFESKQDFTRAIQELRDALKIEANNSDCHSLLGLIYVRTNQVTMAKIHFNKALELNPQDAIALEGKQKIEAPNRKGAARKPDGKGGKPDPKAKVDPKKVDLKKIDPKGKPGPKNGKPDAKGGGGLFGLFGSKKK